MLDDAVERFIAGDFAFSADQPLAMFNDPIIVDLRGSLDLPVAIEQYLGNPEQVLAGIPPLSSPHDICDDFNLSGPLASSAPGLAEVCARMQNMPDGERVIMAFEKVHDISELIELLPQDIAGRISDLIEDPREEFIPSPPEGPICSRWPNLWGC